MISGKKNIQFYLPLTSFTSTLHLQIYTVYDHLKNRPFPVKQQMKETCLTNFSDVEPNLFLPVDNALIHYLRFDWPQFYKDQLSIPKDIQVLCHFAFLTVFLPQMW